MKTIQKLFIASVLFFVFPVLCFADPYVSAPKQYRAGGLTWYKWTISAPASTDSGSGGAVGINGTVVQVSFINGSSAPDDLWDVDFVSSDTGHDALNGVGDNVSNANATSDDLRRVPLDNNGAYIILNEEISLSVTNFNGDAGAASAVVKMAVREN